MTAVINRPLLDIQVSMRILSTAWTQCLPYKFNVADRRLLFICTEMLMTTKTALLLHLLLLLDVSFLWDTQLLDPIVVVVLINTVFLLCWAVYNS
jgi:hypothetical protein